jgi:glycolate oxidase FAD binding subunit
MKPESEADLAEMVKSAVQPVRIRGGGTRRIGGVGAVLETGGLRGITLYEPGALTLVAQAGTPLAEIEAALAGEGQRLAFEPMDHRGLLSVAGEPTIGGVVAANVSGPRRIQSGACRDFLLGVRFVDGTGQVLRNGGRVMKNVTGYDLVKLMAGSWGTLGVLSEVSLKVLPQPEAAACLLIDGLGDREAVEAMSCALGSPFEVTGAAHLPVGLDGTPVTMLRIEGFAQSVTYRLAQLQALFPDCAVRVETDAARVAEGWRYIRDVAPFHDQEGAVWRVSCKPSDAPDLVARLAPQQVVYDWGGGLIWALMPDHVDARARLGAFDGHASLIRSSAAQMEQLGMFQPQPPALRALSGGIKQRFDPKGIFNPDLRL